MPNFEYYKIFFYVAKYRNFTLAAKVLMTSQPSVTRSIMSLEHDLGCRLFVRSPRGVTLTTEGETLYGYVASACDALFKGEEVVGSMQSMDGGPVHIGATQIAIRGFLLDALEAYHNQYADVTIKIINASTPSILADLRSGRIDMAVVTTPVEKDKHLRITKVKSFQDILIAGPNYADLKDKEVSLSEIAEYPLVSLTDGTSTNKFYAEAYAERNIPFRPTIELVSADLLLPVIMKNLAIGFVPKDLAKGALEQGDVIQVKLKEEIPCRHICVVQDSRHPVNTAVRRLLRFMKPEP